MRVLLLLLVACGSSAPPKPEVDAQRATDTVRSYADRCAACNNDKACVQPIRDEWDTYKRAIMKSRELYTPTEQVAFDEKFTKFAMCGDASGLTIWTH